ncbi:DUF4870 domain-containing protein [Virgibacillus dakarensis]|nr:DUF4870 domain-containing protein [Virgibacillus dakarensis]
MDSSSKILASLNYFSIFFAPFLFPIIVYFVVTEKDVKYHAKRAFLSHIVPFVVLLLAIGLGIAFSFSNSFGLATGTIISGYLIAGILYVIFLIWNVVQGIKIFT